MAPPGGLTVCCVQGEPAEVRCSQWSTEGQAMQNGHDGITTFYEAFQQGARTSSTYRPLQTGPGPMVTRPCRGPPLG